eukprot:jgi/Tetstr1/425756/TSEL_016175.t1
MRFETLRRLRYLAKRGDWAFSFDLQDGYYALGLREDVRDFFTINVRGTLWRFAAFPMGWSLSPYYFCTLMAVMVRYLRQLDFATYSSYGRPFRRRLRRRKARGVCLLPFIDDFLFLAPSRELALRLRAEVERVWGRLSLAKHPTKVHPEPTQQLQHLGMDLDLVTMQFRAPAAKLRRLSNLARDLLCIAARRRRHAPAKLLASLARQGQFLYLAMPPARFYLREAHAVMGRCYSPSGKVVLTRQLIRDLEWWRDVPTRHNGAPILRPVETAYLHTDSSQYGWGTEAVDSLAQSDATWRAEVNWCNPPWQLLDDLVLKLQQSGAAATVVAPAWHGRPWLQQLHEMATELLDDLVLKLQQSGAAATVVAPAWHGRPWLQQLHEMATESYGSEFNLFCEFCAQNGRLPDTADPPLIVRYISWVAARGRNKVGAFGPYLSAINAFCTDNFKEPPALGPLVNHAMRGWELAQQVLDAPDYRLPDDDPGTWTAATVSEWVTAAALAIDATPPTGFCWSSHSLRSGGASAASATGVPMPTIRWLGGWKVGSGVVLNYIVPGILDSAGTRYFFGSLAPQRSAANLSQ